MQRAGISISKRWADDDVVEFQISVADETSCFVNRVYVGHEALLDRFIDELRAVAGGTRDEAFLEAI